MKQNGQAAVNDKKELQKYTAGSFCMKITLST